MSELRDAPDEQQLALLLRGVTDHAVVLLERDGTIVTWSPGAERVEGWGAADVVGQHVRIFYPGEQRAAGVAQDGLDAAAQHGRHDEEGWRVRSDGTRFWAGVTTTALRDEDGSLRGFTRVIRDLTRQHDDAEALRGARDEAERAADARRRFLASMSHEIRTPMHAVISMARLLEDTDLDAAQREMVATIRSSGDHLLTVVDEVLDFSAIDAGALQVQPQPFVLREWVGPALDLVAVQAEEHGVELVADVAPDVPEVVVSDPNRLRQVLVNLLGNAVRFTTQGEVVVRVRTAGPDEPDGAVVVEVADTGAGIPADRLDAVLEPFTQADGSSARAHGGSGLGLAICRTILAQLGGGLRLASTLGEGTTVTAWFDGADGAPPAAAQVPELAGHRLLVLVEQPTLQQLLPTWAERAGMEVVVARDTADAVAALRGGATFQQAVVDVAGPVGASEHVARLLRTASPHVRVTLLRRPSPDAALPLVDAVARRPLRESGVVAALRRAVGHADLAASPERRDVFDDADVDPGTAVLVVEDNPVNQRVARHLLGRFGLEPDMASSAGEALAALARRHYDVVLMDVQMPGMDGLAATRELRRRWPGRALRVVAVTANVTEEEEQRCLAAGMDGFLGKPVDVAALAHELVVAGRSRPAAAVPGGPPAGGTGRTLLEVRVVELLAEQLGAGPVRQMLTTFEDQLERLLPAVRAAQVDGDTAVLSSLAHRLKGSAATFGAAALHGVLDELEVAAERSWARTEPLVASLSALADTTREQLHAWSDAAG